MKKTVYYLLSLIFPILIITSCQNSEPSREISIALDTGWVFQQLGQSDWMEADVPGTVHTDLLANKKIEDPFYRLNEHNLQWIDKVDWVYKTSFNIDTNVFNRNRIALDFKGLDTYAEVLVNGNTIFQSENMFREYLVNIKNYVKPGRNELRIIFRSPIVEGIKKYDAQGYVIPVSDNDLAKIGKVPGEKQVSIYTRKAGYHFGWDWGPRLVTSGIWRPVILKAWDESRIENLQIIQGEINSDKAMMQAVFEIEAEESGKARISISNDSKLISSSEIEIKKGIKNYALDFTIENPKLWWTNGLGEAHLYKLKGELFFNGELDSEETRIGIRTLELVRDKDNDGTSFYFKLNGVPVFMKGANYIPNDVFLPRVSKEKLKNVVTTAKNSNFNMLRVWGGGIYEDDMFYDYCDEAGILIWQDFMFACAMYPGDKSFLENVKQEAVDNVKRLRNHPCIGLWCGNNEILDAWYKWGWKNQAEAENQKNAEKTWQAYVDIFHTILPQVVSDYDGQRSYWGSSPSSGIGVPADQKNGDEHYWGVWWGKAPFETYATHLARFMSEYGFQSFPELKTVRQYTTDEDFNIYSEVMKSHQRSSIGNETIEYYLLKEYDHPKDFESFLYVNQVLQAEGIKFALEGHRRAMPYCMGSLYWQINDCWPVASWSSTDYYQRWKALQHFVKKGFEAVLVSPYEENEMIKIGIVNDKQETFDAELELKLLNFDGKIAWEKLLQVNVPANSSNDFFKKNLAELLSNVDSRNMVLSAELYKQGDLISSNLHYFNPYKELNIEHPNIDYKIEKASNGYLIVLTSNKLAKNIYMTIGDEEGFFSDNYFDLLAGKKAEVLLETEINMQRLKEVLSIKTIDTAFESN